MHNLTQDEQNETFFLWPHRLEMHFLEPEIIQPGATAQELKERVYKRMYDYFLANNKA